MVRAAVLLCTVLLVQGTSTRMLAEPPTSRSACSDDGADAGGVAASDDALASQRVVPDPPASRWNRWEWPERSAVSSPAPDEILHVPKRPLA